MQHPPGPPALAVPRKGTEGLSVGPDGPRAGPSREAADVRFAGIWDAHRDRVAGYVRSRLSACDVDDVVAETFLTAWRRLPDVPGNALPWLLVVARNLLARRWRSGTRNLALLAEIMRLQEVAPAATGADVAGEVAERLAVLGALARLAPTDRDVVLLTAWDGLTPRDAARVLGCSTATFTVRLHRARARLVRALAEEDRDGADPGAREGGVG